MQLTEQGRLDLDADVNTYLADFQVPATYPQPVTLRHLLSHTAGFEERTLGGLARSSADLLTLHEYVQRYRPARVRPPGEVTAYSSYGAALAGYIIEHVSGLPFEEYVEAHIFEPLGMARSTFRQPLPGELAGELALGYDTVDTGSVQPFKYVNMAPAGSASATATDMARFMLAHLQDGCCGTDCILQPETVRLMHTRLFTNDPRLSGMAYGFMDRMANGQHLLEHGGGLPPYYGLLALLPAHQVGFYVGFNGQNGWAAAQAFRQAFLDHYFPWQPATPPPPPADFAQRGSQFVGVYRWTRSNETSFERIAQIGGTGFGRVSANANATLTIALRLGSGSMKDHYVEVAPRVFRTLDGRYTVVFRADESGTVTHLLLDNENAFERVAWYEAPWFSLAMLAVGLIGMLSTLAAGAASLFVKLRPDDHSGRGPRLARWWAIAFSAAALLMVAAVIRLMQTGGLSYGAAFDTVLLLGLAWLVALLMLGVLVFAGLAWRRSYWGWAGRLHYTLVALAGSAFLWVLAHWNLLAFGI
jgi:hypothetical protein